MTSSRRRAWGLTLCVALALAPGCATMPGLLTGAFTGAVDAPMQVYRKHRTFFDRNPIYWPFNVLFFVPVGIAAGPIVGMAKGMALDIQWLLDQMGYNRVFGTYREPSIWRPYTLHWSPPG
jgi:hypothetical protein